MEIESKSNKLQSLTYEADVVNNYVKRFQSINYLFTELNQSSESHISQLIEKKHEPIQVN